LLHGDVRHRIVCAFSAVTVAAQLSWELSGSLLAAWRYSPQRLLPADQFFQIDGPTIASDYEANPPAGNNGYYFDA
jgi:hypothetical protein